MLITVFISLLQYILIFLTHTINLEDFFYLLDIVPSFMVNCSCDNFYHMADDEK